MSFHFHPWPKTLKVEMVKKKPQTKTLIIPLRLLSTVECNWDFSMFVSFGWHIFNSNNILCCSTTGSGFHPLHAMKESLQEKKISIFHIRTHLYTFHNLRKNTHLLLSYYWVVGGSVLVFFLLPMNSAYWNQKVTQNFRCMNSAHLDCLPSNPGSLT